MNEQALADHSFRELLDVFAAPVPVPGGGSLAALAAAGAAALVERCASVAPGPGFAHARARAGALRSELMVLADTDSAALASLVGASRAYADRVAGAAADASRPPALVQIAAAEISELAASLGRGGKRAFVGEARCAMLLADAAARMAHAIIELNLALADRDT
jgi:formiminotetrahydrofolate cyclodeaminase